jgi:hypothetical protein
VLEPSGLAASLGDLPVLRPPTSVPDVPGVPGLFSRTAGVIRRLFTAAGPAPAAAEWPERTRLPSAAL